MKYKELKKRLLKDPKVKRLYEARTKEYVRILLHAILFFVALGIIFIFGILFVGIVISVIFSFN